MDASKLARKRKWFTALAQKQMQNGNKFGEHNRMVEL